MMTPFEALLVLSNAGRGSTAAYDAWRAFVDRLSRGQVTDGSRSDAWTIPPEMREVVVEDVQTHLVLRASDIIERVIIPAVGGLTVLHDLDVVLAPTRTTDLESALAQANRVLAKYVRTSLARRFITEQRKGSRRVERELRQDARAAHAQIVTTHSADDEVEVSDDYRRAMEAYDFALAAVVASVDEDTGATYRRRSDELKALTGGARSMDAVILVEVAADDPRVAADFEGLSQNVRTALGALAPHLDTSDVEAAEDCLRARDPVRLRQCIDELMHGLEGETDAINRLASATEAFCERAEEVRQSKAGERARNRVYTAHKRLREKLQAELTAEVSNGVLDETTAIFASRVIAQLLTRRRQKTERTSVLDGR